MYKLFSTLYAGLTSLWWPTGVSLEPIEVVLYTRRGCHLCHEAWERLQRAAQKYPIRIIVIDVDSDPQLVAQYGNEVPVVTVNGQLRFRGALNEALLTRLLWAEVRRRVKSPASSGS